MNTNTKTVRVEFEIDVPDAATDKEIEDWVGFYVGATGQLAGDNPMSDTDLNAKCGSVSVR